jgi:hypothetical protein
LSVGLPDWPDVVVFEVRLRRAARSWSRSLSSRGILSRSQRLRAKSRFDENVACEREPARARFHLLSAAHQEAVEAEIAELGMDELAARAPLVNPLPSALAMRARHSAIAGVSSRRGS